MAILGDLERDRLAPMIDMPDMAPSTRSARCILTALLMVPASAGCVSSGEDPRLPVRVNPVPAGVDGLGPARPCW